LQVREILLTRGKEQHSFSQQSGNDFTMKLSVSYLFAVSITGYYGSSIGGETFNTSIPLPNGNNSKQVLATVAENICLQKALGQTDSLCADRPLQSQVGGGACMVVSQAYFSVVDYADLAFQDIAECEAGFTKGSFTYKDVHTILPYPSDTVETYVMTGQQVLSLVNDAFNAYFYQGNTDAYPVGAGLRWYVNASLGSGKSVTKVEVNPRLMGNWTVIDLNQTYVVATNSYSSDPTNFGYNTFGSIDKGNSKLFINTTLSMEQALVQYAMEQQTISDVPPETYSTQSIVFKYGKSVSLASLEGVSNSNASNASVPASIAVNGTSPPTSAPASSALNETAPTSAPASSTLNETAPTSVPPSNETAPTFVPASNPPPQNTPSFAPVSSPGQPTVSTSNAPHRFFVASFLLLFAMSCGVWWI